MGFYQWTQRLPVFQKFYRIKGVTKLTQHPIALVTGASRGIGAATALALADRGYDVIITYRNKSARANEVATSVTQKGVRVLSLQCDITQSSDLEALFAALKAWSGRLDLLVLNAAGGLERDLIAGDPSYPMRINRDAQLALVDGALPLMYEGGTIIFVTSHWAHMHGKVNYPLAYTPVASTKHAGEQALRARQQELAEHGIRLLIVTGDLIKGTFMAKVMERIRPGITQQREEGGSKLPTVTETGIAIAEAAMDKTLPSGYTVVVGGALDTLPHRE
jgi:NAD(P)-dependent dehydrogenase (short-subunit alcohol dehydrogenase family)